MRNLIARIRDGVALALGGLSPRSRVITPLVPDDRFQMALSRYLFACRYAQGRTVLDLGCGSGFGSEVLRKAGARRVVGIEEHSGAVQHARKRYGSPQVEFREAPLVLPGGDLDSQGLVLAFDLVAHYRDSASLLDRITGWVDADGVLVLGAPLVRSPKDIELAQASGRLTVLYPTQWAAHCVALFRDVRFFRHCAPSSSLDWNAPAPSRFAATDFRFEEEESAEALAESPGLSALFVCRARRP